jgi:membrane carboxypeptidase/penicillin-binding protein
MSISAVLSPASAFVTTQMLKDVLTYGTAKTLKSFVEKRPAAGKTGTTDDHRDAWFIGYTPQIITGVWVGYDRPRPGGSGFTGGAVCAPVWGQFMRGALAGKTVAEFLKPDTVVRVMIDPETNELATPLCPVQREEFYIKDTQPVKPCTKHGVPNEEPAPVAQPQAPSQPVQEMEIP